MMLRIGIGVFCVLQSLGVTAQSDGFTGYATASIKTGSIDIRTYGFRDAAGTKVYDSTTIQPVGSVSKTVIGLAIMKAAELGLLSLDTDINTYLSFPVKHPLAT
jgi:CubicO group peptidase (beta-lactamase class C family)